jgi:hypothetical protein
VRWREDVDVKILYRRDVIRRVRDRWLAQYKSYSGDTIPMWRKDGRSIQSIRAALAALDLETCSTEDVDLAIGTTGWASIRCDECDRDDLDKLIHIGDEEGYDSRWQYLCGSCLSQASAMLADK